MPKGKPGKPPKEETQNQSKIEQLLRNLKSADADKREDAVDSLHELGVNNKRVVSTLSTAAQEDKDKHVRMAAKEALIAISREKKPSEPAQPELSRNEKIIRFSIGFVGWYVANGLYWYGQFHGVTNTNTNGEYILANLICFPVNLLALITLSAAKQTRWTGLGILGALALNLLLSLIVGMSINGWCFIPFYVK